MKSLKFLGKYLHSSIGLFVFALISAIINVLCVLLIPVYIGKGIDVIIGVGAVQFETLKDYLLIVLICAIVGAIFSYTYEMSISFAANRIVRQLRYDTYKKFNYVTLNFIDIHSTGDFTSRATNDIEIISAGLLEGFKQLYKGVITIIFTLVLMFTINYILALVVFTLTPLSLFTSKIIAKKSYQFYSKNAKQKGEMSAYIHEIFHQRKVVKSLNYNDSAYEKFKEMNNELHKTGQNAVFASSLTNPTTRFINGLVYAAVGIVGAILIIKGNTIVSLTVGGLSAFLSYANQYTKPFNEISGVISEFQNALSSLDRVKEIIEADNVLDDGEITKLDEFKTLSFDNVSFSYVEKQKLIQNFNLTVNKGEHIAIVGPTGCGKTTLINLLLRFYDVSKGSISINGINIKDIKREELRNKFSMVLQDTWLFEGTVFENITFGNNKATKEDVIKVCKDLGVHGFISRLPNGYDTIINNGDSLSHGEKQLITIARIMINITDIVILDEATSSIDARSELMIQKAFSKITKTRTSFVIAHRLSTIKNADKILVMKNGNIIETGSHKELMNLNGFYAELYHSQYEEK